MKLDSLNTVTSTLLRRWSRTAPLVAAITLTVGSAFGQTSPWESIYLSSSSSNATGVTVDPAGSIFVAGAVRPVGVNRHAVLLKSSDGGETWDANPSTPESDDPVDVLTPNGNFSWFQAVVSRAVFDGVNPSVNHVVSAGQVMPGTPSPLGAASIIRRSEDGGQTWSTIDLYQHPSYYLVPSDQQPGRVAIDGAGTVFALSGGRRSIVTTKGKTTTTTYQNHWLIRRGVTASDGTVSWTETDIHYPTTKEHLRQNVYPSAVACVGSDVYVVGGGGGDGGNWRVLKSSNGVGPWVVSDDYRLDTRDLSHAHCIAADSEGNVYVAGTGYTILQSGLKVNWIIRRKAANATTWTIVDQFEAPNNGGYPRSIAATPGGRMAVTASYPQGWLTREGSTFGTWTTTDNLIHTAGFESYPTGIASDAFGNLFAAGVLNVTQPQGAVIPHWLVRRKLAP